MKRRAPLILLLLLVLSVNMYYRSYPIEFPNLKSEARRIVENAIMQGVSQDIDKKFPQFYPSAKEKILKTRFAEYKKSNRDSINNEINSLYLKFKDKYQDDSGQTYIMELDCWHWARYVENVLKFGHPGDEVIFGRQWDRFMLAPSGMYLYWEHFLYYFSAFLYKAFSFFKLIPLFKFLFYVPLFFAGIFLAILFLFSFRHSGYIGAVLSSSFVGLSTLFLHRSCAGWFDKDVLNLIFPLVIMWTYVEGIGSLSLRRRILWILFSSLWVGLFCFDWTHWWFIFFIIIIYEGLCIEFFGIMYFYHSRKISLLTGEITSDILQFKKRYSDLLKQHALATLSFIIFSIFWIIVFSGLSPLEIFLTHIKRTLILSKPLMSSIWPNVYFTVGEMKQVNVQELAASLGGVYVFSSAVIGMVILLARSLSIPSYSSSKRAAVIILAIWFISMFFATLKGIRFGVFLLVPTGIFIGWIMDELYEYFSA